MDRTERQPTTQGGRQATAAPRSTSPSNTHSPRTILDLQRVLGNRAVRRMIQRQLVNSATRLTPDINLAESIPRGLPSGLTPPMVNDQVMPVPQSTAAPATAALQAPEIAVEPNAAGDGHQARVTRAPTNRVGGEIHYPTAPVWVDAAAHPLRISGVAIGGEAPTKRFAQSATLAALNRVQATRFRARGEIGDAGFRQQILVHEQHHAADHWAAAQTVMGPWDAAITTAQATNQTFDGATPEAARAAVFDAAGGTMRQLGERLDAEWGRLDHDFHRNDPLGAPSNMSHYFIEPDGSKVDGWYEYPY